MPGGGGGSRCRGSRRRLAEAVVTEPDVDLHALLQLGGIIVDLLIVGGYGDVALRDFGQAALRSATAG
ncbi:hypothetical protein DFR69_104678 [Nocardia neocaledoniensis]|uniref:Uncharacterized protein n=1 Tax=Nocardia neocaledoniensis TaxID=236511 RepID=A0A317NPX4_9NOCA|nr:hypothetical protein DFR69_104678 [Nocardia neocaledoniensis]